MAARDRTPESAIRAAVAAGDHARCRELLVRFAGGLVSTGAAAVVRDAVRALPPGPVDPAVAACHAEALYVTGAVDEALTLFQRLSGGTGPLPAGLAWRYGFTLHLSGDPAGALDVLRRGTPEESADGALLIAWTATLCWSVGDTDACVDLATRAERAARAADDPRCLAAAHVALALAAQLQGDRPAVQAHQDRALRAAEVASDVFSIVRIRTNRSASLLHEARYADALEVVRPAVALADAVGYLPLLAAAQGNEAEALARLGRLDESVRAYERAAAVYQGLGSDKVAYALAGLGDVHRLRRRDSQARAAYEEALRAAGDIPGDPVRVLALAGLARVIARTEPASAAGLAAEAVEAAPGPFLAVARLAVGWVGAAAAEAADGPARTGPAWARVRAIAAEAAEAARRHRAVAELAQALELAGHAADEPARARQALTEALAIWRDAGAAVDADRVLLALARATGRHEDQVPAALAADRLAAAGVVLPVEPDQVRITALGRFAVSIGGRALPAGAWQSRKARDLVRILVARRGRTVSRDEMAELLWPGEPADRVAHRLSVALSTARQVLDPSRRAPTDHAICAGSGSLALNLATVTLDAERFAAYMRHGLSALRAGRHSEARGALEAAERAYTGDFFEDEPYVDVAVDAREELRAMFLQALRALAELARADGRPDDAVRYLHRVLGVDRYDDPAHRALFDVLTAHGRHGEAQRARERHTAVMAELGLTDLAS